MSPQPKRGPSIHMAASSKGYLWKMSCLRPAPPTRSFIDPDKKKKKDPDTTYEEDMQILRVIEAYAQPARNTSSTSGNYYCYSCKCHV